MSFKSLIVTALMMILIAIPAYGDVRVEWDSGVNLSSSATASVWDWQTGFRTSGDWTLAPNLSLFLRDRVVRDSRNEDWYGDLERGYLQYESGPVRVKLGRQAVNWGIGWFFRPNDLITPAANALSHEDTRPGMDLATLYWATSPLTATELVAGDRLLAARTEWRIGPTNLRFLGVDNAEGLKYLGIDFQGGLAGIYGEGRYGWTESQGFENGKPALLLGWSKALGGGKLLYLEAFKDISKLYYGSENYAATGVEIPVDEFTSFTVAGIGNLDDGGCVITGLVTSQINDNLDLNGAIVVLAGSENTEFLTRAGGYRFTLNLGAKYYF